MFSTVSLLFIEEGIPFMLMYGTLLGWARHGGMIPWDDNLDIGCLRIYELDILKVMEKVKEKGFVVKRHTGGDLNKDTPPYDYITITYSKTNSNHLDIALLGPTSNNKYIMDSTNKGCDMIQTKDDVKKWRAWLFEVNLIFPIQQTNYYGIVCYVPNKYEELLKIRYGNDVFKVAYVKKSEVPGIMVNLTKNIRIKNFKPAETLKKETKIKKENTDLGIYKAFIINISGRQDRLHNTINECDKVGYGVNKYPL